MKVLLKYKQREHINWELQGPCGGKRWVYVNKTVDYDQFEEVEESNVKQRIKELKSFKNRLYHSFSYELLKQEVMVKNSFTMYENLVVNNIELDGYGYENQEQMSLFDKIQAVNTIFHSEYGHEVKRYGERKAFTEWLQGLPSSLSVPFYNYEILQIAYIHGLIEAKASEEQEDKFLAEYWDKVADAFFTLRDNL